MNGTGDGTDREETEKRIRSFGKRSDPPRITIAAGDTVRTFEIDTTMIVGGVVAVTIFTVVYVGATAYAFFRDDLMTGMIQRQVNQARAYEDRVSTLRAEIDRINARQLIDQEAFEAKIDTLLARQTQLSKSQVDIAAIIDRARQQGLKLATPASASLVAPAVAKAGAAGLPRLPALGGATETGSPGAAPAPAAPAPLDIDGFRAPLRSSWLPSLIGTAHAANPVRDPAARIAAVEHQLDLIAGAQMQASEAIARAAETDAGRIEGIVGRLGFRIPDPKAGQPRPKPLAEDVGGPFVPADPSVAADRAADQLDRFDRASRAARSLPLGKPVDGDPPITSPFGTRPDPFLGTMALHTGLDLRAPEGEPVHATAAGTVTDAGRQGGYGIMVEIDHGNGVSTRFGHLSRVAVADGQKVATGDIIGYAGSTGRSTGPHLHYETRVNGEPLDPEPWLEAGKRLRAVFAR